MPASYLLKISRIKRRGKLMQIKWYLLFVFFSNKEEIFKLIYFFYNIVRRKSSFALLGFTDVK
jgi:hypothetical protein